jgi:hypothetical protein
VPFEAIDAALNRVPGLVVLGIELGWSAAMGATLLAVVGLVGLVRDGAADTAPAQVGTVLPGRVRLVAADPIGSSPRPTGTKAGDANLPQDGLELRGVTSLSSSDHYGHGLLPLLNGQVQFGGQAAARASEAVVVRLDRDAAGRLDLQGPFFRAPAACWWARQTVESILRSQVMSSLASA